MTYLEERRKAIEQEKQTLLAKTAIAVARAEGAQLLCDELTLNLKAAEALGNMFF